MTDGDENAYDEFALAYAKSNESNAWNAYYERPAVLGLVGDVAGHDYRTPAEARERLLALAQATVA